MFTASNTSKLRHGHAKRGQQTGEHRCWQAMKRRCLDPKHSHFLYYGGKGIEVCDRWANSFENFLADMGPKPTPKHTLDRYPNRSGNYEPSNCRWATRLQQSANRDCTIQVEYGGETVRLTDLCRRLNLDPKVFDNRLRLGWNIERAISQPVGKPIPGRHKVP